MPNAPLPAPEEVLAWTPADIDAALARWERQIPVRPPLFELESPPAKSALVFGDTHGDWRSTIELLDRYERAPEGTWLVGLGDYVDRAPSDAPGGSAVNLVLLFEACARAPERIVLLQGNHETARRIPVFPETLPDELEALWGPSPARLNRFRSLLERGPLAATTTSGAYLAHAGFPRGDVRNARAAFSAPSPAALTEIVWAECGASSIRRGAATPFDERDLTDWLRRIGATVFLRGHDPDLTGRSVYGDRCLTLHTTRIFERYGGVLLAHLPLDRRIDSVRDVPLEHLPSEGRRWSSVP